MLEMEVGKLLEFFGKITLQWPPGIRGRGCEVRTKAKTGKMGQ